MSAYRICNGDHVAVFLGGHDLDRRKTLDAERSGDVLVVNNIDSTHVHDSLQSCGSFYVFRLQRLAMLTPVKSEVRHTFYEYFEGVGSSLCVRWACGGWVCVCGGGGGGNFAPRRV